MKGIHPNTNRVATCALLMGSLAVGGCRSSSSSGLAGNPFLAPDRVAPPSTRAIAPGQAQPYYQGDPLPVMQSSTAPSENATAAVPSATETLTSTGRSLAWNTPGAGVPQSLTAGQWPASPTPATISRGNEPAVAVPADSDSLRFALPAPINPEPAAMPIAAAAPSNPQPIQFGAAPPSQATPGVTQASYTAPIPSAAVANQQSSAISVPTIPAAPQQAASPWRQPQLAPSTTPSYGMQPAQVAQQAVVQPASGSTPSYTIPAVPPNLYAQQPAMSPTSAMAVQMRSVPSPPLPGDPNPRIRIPGYEVPQTAAADGFRARTSMR